MACPGDDMCCGSALEFDRVSLRNTSAPGTYLHDVYSNGRCVYDVWFADAR